MRYQISLLFLTLLLALGGCGPKLSRADLGTVVFELPKVAGTDQPYPMPQLGPPVEEENQPSEKPLPQD